MTRETKIGLLVGLAFIIVIGILIADYSANSMRRPPAPMMDAMQNVLDSANNPGVRRPNGQVPKGTSAPQRMIGQDGRQSTPDIRIMPPGQNDVPFKIGGGDRGQEASGRLPVQLKPQDSAGNTSDPKPAASVKEIVAVEKDTVYKWAKKYMGTPTQANIEAIINANPALKGNKPIRIGDKYKIPVETPTSASRERDAAAPVAPTRPERPNATERPDRTETADRTERSASAERTDRAERPETAERDAKLISYTTKRGDNLWRIAERQCGDGRLASKIRELNNLRGDDIHPEMTLKLPAKGT